MGSTMKEKFGELNFRHVLGKTEMIGGTKPSTIRKGKPLTWDTNNGVTVIYDGNGDPWVHQGVLEVSDLQRGAHVPFSNDGGFGIRQLFPDRPE